MATKILTNSQGKALVNASGKAYLAPEGSTPVSHPNPTISVNTSTGLITASHTQESGAVTGGTTTATEQLTTQAAQTITPTTTAQTIASGKYLTGAQTIEGDANLVAGNIKNGTSIFGVVGTYTGGTAVTHPKPTISVNTSTGLITASHTQDSGLVTGGTTSETEQLSTQGAQTITPTTTAQTIASGKYLTGTQTIEGDADLVASNIKSGVTIFGVEGSYTGGSVLTPTAGDYPVVGNGGLGGGGSSLASTGISITIPVTGTYRLKWCAFRRSTSTSYSWGSQLYRTRSGTTTTGLGSENTTWPNTYCSGYGQVNSLDIACNEGDVITVYVRGRSSSYSCGGMLTACVAQKLWTN